MSFYERYYHRMPDGTIKQINPFNTTEVWCVTERGRKAPIQQIPKDPIPIKPVSPEHYCHFCEADYTFTPPEKSRVYKDTKGNQQQKNFTTARELSNESALFRRVGNLFEIVTFDYWAENYGYQMSARNLHWKEKYLSTDAGVKHALNVLRLKHEMQGLDFDSLSIEEKFNRMNPFFGGCHELIIGGKHYIDGAHYQHELWSSGEMTPEEHEQYILLTLNAMTDIIKQNPYVRYISVFQNWLKPAGASIDHLHKQLVGLDEWGVQIEQEIQELIKNPNLYNAWAANFALYNNLMIAESDYAISFTEIGHRFPTIAIYSKSKHGRPFEHSPEEIRGMSDMIHAVHAALGSQTTCNEEWYYSPFDSIHNSPWHVLIKIRINVPAGFEGNTKIYINPISPERLKNELIHSLYKKREACKIDLNIHIGSEITTGPNPLNYHKEAALPVRIGKDS